MDQPFRFGVPSAVSARETPGALSRLEEFLRDTLKQPVELSTPATYDALAKELLTGKVGAAWAPPFVCARVEAMGIRIVARGVRRGASSYRAALLCRASRPLTLETLQGTKALWVDQNSVGGFLLPLALLKAQKRDPERVFFTQEFAGSYKAALEGVLSGRADVTTVYAPVGLDSDVPAIEELVPGRSSELAVIAFTEESPNDGIAVTMGTPEPVAAALERGFVDLFRTPEGKSLLRMLFNADRFELAPRMGYRALYRVALATL